MVSKNTRGFTQYYFNKIGRTTTMTVTGAPCVFSSFSIVRGCQTGYFFSMANGTRKKTTPTERGYCAVRARISDVVLETIGRAITVSRSNTTETRYFVRATPAKLRANVVIAFTTDNGDKTGILTVRPPRGNRSLSIIRVNGLSSRLHRRVLSGVCVRACVR